MRFVLCASQFAPHSARNLARRKDNIMQWSSNHPNSAKHPRIFFKMLEYFCSSELILSWDSEISGAAGSCNIELTLECIFVYYLTMLFCTCAEGYHTKGKRLALRFLPFMWTGKPNFSLCNQFISQPEEMFLVQFQDSLIRGLLCLLIILCCLRLYIIWILLTEVL